MITVYHLYLKDSNPYYVQNIFTLFQGPQYPHPLEASTQSPTSHLSIICMKAPKVIIVETI